MNAVNDISTNTTVDGSYPSLAYGTQKHGKFIFQHCESKAIE